jgi:hypothetical protein
LTVPSRLIANGVSADVFDHATWDRFADYQLCPDDAGHVTEELRIRLEKEHVA